MRSLNSTQIRILTDLLDRFERRTAERLVSLRVTEGKFPEYFEERDPARVQCFSEAILILQSAGWVRVDMGRGALSHRIVRIVLEEREAPAIASALKRVTAEEYRGALRDRGTAFRETMGELASRGVALARESLEYGCARIFERQGGLPSAESRAESLREIDTLLRALTALSENAWRVGRGERPIVTWRRFAVRTFGDSKALDGMKGPVMRAAHSLLWGEIGPEGPDPSALSYFGIRMKEEVFHFCGPIDFRVGPHALSGDRDFRPFASLAASTALASETSFDLSRATRVLTIENEEAFQAACSIALDTKGEFEGFALVYGAGFPSLPRIEWLRRLAAGARAAGIPFYHWSDIDLGGVRILLHLERELGMTIHPYRMGEEEWATATQYARPLGDREKIQLATLEAELAMRGPMEDAVRDVIRSMLKRGLKSEQEALL